MAFAHKLLCMAYFWPVDFYAVVNHPLDQFLNLQERKIGMKHGLNFLRGLRNEQTNVPAFNRFYYICIIPRRCSYCFNTSRQNLLVGN